MNTNIDESWKNILQSEFEKDSFKSLTKFIKSFVSNVPVKPQPPVINICIIFCVYNLIFLFLNQ